MSWHSTYSPRHPGSEDRTDPKVDRSARPLATEADDNWDQMSAYPGFECNRWREKAKQILAMTGANGNGGRV